MIQWVNSQVYITFIAFCAGNNNILLRFISESGTISIIGGNLTVKHFDQAVFVCVATGWFPDPQVSWRIDDIMADPEYYNTTVDAAGTQFNSYSTLSISAVDSAQIQCLAKVSALFTPQTSTVFLKVGKNVILSQKVFITKASNYSFFSFA